MERNVVFQRIKGQYQVKSDSWTDTHNTQIAQRRHFDQKFQIHKRNEGFNNENIVCEMRRKCCIRQS